MKTSILSIASLLLLLSCNQKTEKKENDKHILVFDRQKGDAEIILHS